MFAEYLKAFVIGGLLCAIAQILIDKTKLTPARILVAYVCSGVLLGAIGVYGPLADFAGAGATVPLTGFGYLISTGVREAVDERGCRRNHGVSRVFADRRFHFQEPPEKVSARARFNIAV